jgi:hypothetical protein
MRRRHEAATPMLAQTVFDVANGAQMFIRADSLGLRIRI